MFNRKYMNVMITFCSVKMSEWSHFGTELLTGLTICSICIMSTLKATANATLKYHSLFLGKLWTDPF